MINHSNIKNVLVQYKSDEYIDFLYNNINIEKATPTTLYPHFLKKFLESYYNISLSGGPNPGQARYWIVRGFSLEEANILKKDISSKYACNSIDAIMKRYKVDKNTAENMKKEMTDKGINTLKTKYTPDELNIINKKKATNSKVAYIKKYGEEQGILLWNEHSIKRMSLNSLNGYIDRYGLEQGTIKYNEFIQHMSTVHTLEYHIKKYGKEQGIAKYNNTCNKKAYSSSLEFYIEKYGKEQGTINFNNRQKKWQSSLNSTMINSRTSNNRFRASKESLSFLIPIYKFARKNGIKRNDIYIGAGGLSEYIRYYNGSIIAYDFVIESIKLVVEYDGAAFHPKSINEENWIHPYHKQGPEQYFIKDQEKKDYIINKGFIYFNIRSDDNAEIKHKKIKDIINYIKSNTV